MSLWVAACYRSSSEAVARRASCRSCRRSLQGGATVAVSVYLGNAVLAFAAAVFAAGFAITAIRAGLLR
jgi:hypothetical protein